MYDGMRLVPLSPNWLISIRPQVVVLVKNNYRPQRSWGKVMFIHLFVILSTGGSAIHPLGRHPPCEVHAGIRSISGRTHPTGMQSCLSLHIRVFGKGNKVVYSNQQFHKCSQKNSRSKISYIQRDLIRQYLACHSTALPTELLSQVVE